MHEANDYLVLRQAFRMIPDNTPHFVTIPELASVWHCTPRNAKIIVHKLQGLGWIDFVPGIGRGNKSTLAFSKNKEAILFAEAGRLLQRGEVHAAADLFRLYADEAAAKEQFTQWLSAYFGYELDATEQSEIETLRFPIYRTINTLDPASAFYALDCHLISQIFNTLVRYNTTTGSPEPELAHHWESNEDCTEWTFYLRKGVLFHNGKELCADDVIHSLQRLQDCSQQWLVRDITHIAALGRYAVSVQLSKPNHLFLRFLSFPAASIVASDVYVTDDAGTAYAPVGTGPFFVQSANPDYCLLKAFSHHFRERPHLDQVEIVNLQALESYWKTSPVHDVVVVDSGEAAVLRIPDSQEVQRVNEGSTILTFNFNRPGPHRHAQFRQALNLLIHREQMLQELGNPRIYPAGGFALAEERCIEGNENAQQAVPNLLQEICYNGEPIHIYTYKRHADDAYWIQQRCKANNINAEVHIVGWHEMQSQEKMQDADCIIFEMVFSEEYLSLLETYQSNNSFVRAHLGPELCKTVDGEIQRLLTLPSKAEHLKVLHQLEDLLKSQNALLFLTHKRLHISFPASVQGLALTSRHWIDFKGLWFRSNASPRQPV